LGQQVDQRAAEQSGHRLLQLAQRGVDDDNVGPRQPGPRVDGRAGLAQDGRDLVVEREVVDLVGDRVDDLVAQVRVLLLKARPPAAQARVAGLNQQRRPPFRIGDDLGDASTVNCRWRAAAAGTPPATAANRC
jgi:hypothetical protein